MGLDAKREECLFDNLMNFLLVSLGNTCRSSVAAFVIQFRKASERLGTNAKFRERSDGKLTKLIKKTFLM